MWGHVVVSNFAVLFRVESHRSALVTRDGDCDRCDFRLPASSMADMRLKFKRRQHNSWQQQHTLTV
jgi:hypothetical protein